MSTLTEILSEDPVRIAFAIFAAGVFYAHIVLLTRISGKRTLAEMTTFDFITNVSIGSILPASIVTRGIAFWTGLAVLSALIGFQYATTWFATRSARFERWVTNPPRLLYCAGQFDEESLRAERITRQQLSSKLREQGYASLMDIDVIVMETSGRIAVLRRDDQPKVIAELPDPAGRA